MAKASRPEDDSAPRSGKRRRRPQTLDLKAKEVSGSAPREGAAKAEQTSASTSKQEKKAASGSPGGDWESWFRAQSERERRAFLPVPVLTGAIGVLAGALVVYFLMPQGESADPRVGKLTDEVATLSAKIESLAARPLPQPAPPPDQSELLARIDKLTAAISESEQRLAAMENRPVPKAPDLSAVNERTAAIEGSLKELRAGLTDIKRIAEQAPEAASPQAVDNLAGRIGGLEQRIAALAEARAAPPPANIDFAADVGALNALSSAVRSGAPFAQELKAAQTRLGERAAELATLAPFAAAGLPTVKQLEARFTELAPQLLRGPEPNGNFFERLVTNATRLVEVRPVGEPEGSTPGAIVARAETKLARGDLNGAIAEVESLPEPAKAAAAKWLEAARQRRDSDALLRRAVEAALKEAKGAAQP